MKIILATNNPSKVADFSGILYNLQEQSRDLGIEILTPKSLGIDFDCEEDGETYHENALKKAKTLHKMLPTELKNIPVFADDSGIEVEALGGRPGVFSARYGAIDGKNLSDTERNALLLKELNGIENRKASQICVLVCILDSTGAFQSIHSSWDGEISKDLPGPDAMGFSYDSIFWLPELNLRASELSLSHRAQSFRKLVRVLARHFGCA